MVAMTDWIVGLWFLPVTLCIVLPLLMLCGYLFFRLIMPPKERRKSLTNKAQPENVSLQAEES